MKEKTIESWDIGDVSRHVDVRIMSENDKVVVAFGELVAWVAMPPLEAIQLADHIKSEAEAILRSDV